MNGRSDVVGYHHLWFSTVLAIESGLRQSGGGALEVYFNGQWIPIVLCNSHSNECKCEFME